jgi:hypothetical protein
VTAGGPWLAASGGGAAVLLRSSFTAPVGSARFYLLTAGLAATWTAGALSAGPVRWRGGARAPDLIVVPVAAGAATFAAFYAAARVAK